MFNRQNIKQQWLNFLCAVQFLTRLPIHFDVDYSETRLNQAVGYYPLVGACIGLIVFGSYWLASAVLPSTVAVLLSLCFSLMLTGAFHEDGFADMCDGIGGGLTAERSLEIMRDSRLGTYGVAGLIMMLMLKTSLLVSIAELSSNFFIAAVFILSHALSRTSAVAVIASSRYVRTEGAAKPVADGLNNSSGLIAIATSLILIIAFCLFNSWFLGLYSLAFVALGHIAARRIFEKKLGGYTGDCLGAVQQISEVSFLIGVLVWLYTY